MTGEGPDPYNHYNTCFVCKHRQHVDGKIWKSTIVLLIQLKFATVFCPYGNDGKIMSIFAESDPKLESKRKTLALSNSPFSAGKQLRLQQEGRMKELQPELTIINGKLCVNWLVRSKRI